MKKLAFVVACAALAGCASTQPVPADKLARAQGSVRSAEELNAEADPQAALHLRLAHEQLEVAKRMLVKGEAERAKHVLSRAEADADVAMNMARAKSARIEAQKAMQDVEQTRMQIQQQQGGSQ